ncbi:MAG TPA: tetratricopeptide repeat protein, partial [Polyangiaceae bacterium]|nr:tetratricopeptide repeat protein [Polyangiaceae bacterium]
MTLRVSAGPRAAWRGRQLGLTLLTGALALACGASPVVQEAPRVPDARKAALGKMVRAVEQSRAGTPSDEALALLTRAVEEDPDLWEARYNLGVLLARRGDLVRARQELERARELAPNAEDVVVALGEVLRRAEEHPAAVSVLTAFVSRFESAARARRELVTVLREARQLELALTHARALLKQSPGDPAALAELALTHLELGQVEVAELLIQRALESGRSHAAVVERAAGLIA